MFRISQFLAFVQTTLFPRVEETLGPLTKNERELTRILEFLHIEDFVRDLPSGFRGQQPVSRKPIARAFVAKAQLGLETTSDLIERLKSSPNLRRICGWEHPQDIPSEATFSRAFASFSASELPQKIHELLIRTTYQDEIVQHVSRDSTAINGREKAEKRPSKEPQQKRKRGRPRKGEQAAPKEPTRLQRQQTQELSEMLDELPTACDWGCKKNSKGRVEYWKGYKLHLDVVDGGVPVNATLTSASVHDSQAAIPLILSTTLRVVYLYDVMDAAYDSKEITDYSVKLGHEVLVDSNPRRKEKLEMEPARKERFKQRSTVERANGRLKDEFLGRQVWVRGPTKVMAHLMFGVLVLTADALFRLAS